MPKHHHNTTLQIRNALLLADYRLFGRIMDFYINRLISAFLLINREYSYTITIYKLTLLTEDSDALKSLIKFLEAFLGLYSKFGLIVNWYLLILTPPAK